MSTSLLSPVAAKALKELERNKVSKLWSWQSLRLHMAFLLCGAMAANGLMRGSMSLAMVVMVNSTIDTTSTVDPSLFAENSTYIVDELPLEEPPDDHYNREYQVDWDSSEQAQVHTAFYIGAFISIFLADSFTKIFDAKTTMTIAIIINIIGSIVTPFAVIYVGHYLVVAAIRFLMGFGSGLITPCCFLIIAKWFPLTEKSSAVAIVTTGNQVGIALSMVVTAKLCQLSIGGGWPVAFVLYGITTLMYTAFWQVRASSRPRDSSYITATELEYITGRRGVKSRAMSISMETPWKKILLSPCIIAICLNSFAQSFVLIGLVTYLPKFNQDALKMDLASNGFWSSGPFFVQMFTKMGFGLLADSLKQRKISVTIVTKIFNAIATFGAAIFIFLTPFAGYLHPTLAVLSICIAMGLFGAFVPGYNTAIVCVAPQFTATISSYQQLFAQAASATAPFIIGLMTREGTFRQWRFVHYMHTVVLVIAGISFQFFGHGRAEHWGRPAPSISLSPIDDVNANEVDGLNENDDCSCPAGICNRRGETASSKRGTNSKSVSFCIHNTVVQVGGGNSRPSKISYRDYRDLGDLPTTIDELENDVCVD